MEAPLTPSGGRGEMAMSPPRCALPFSLHGDFSQHVGARCSDCPTGACSSQRSVFNFNVSQGLLVVGCLLRGWLSSSRVGSSGSCESRLRQNTAREGMGAVCSQRATVEAFPIHETQRLAPGRAKSQVPRDARYWWTYQRHRGNVGTMVLSHKRAPPARATNTKTGGRLTQAPAGTNPTTGQAAVYF